MTLIYASFYEKVNGSIKQHKLRNLESGDIIEKTTHNEMKEVKISIVLFALCSIALLNCVSAMGCPDKCSCQQRTVRCIRQQLKAVPELPADTNIV